MLKKSILEIYHFFIILFLALILTILSFKRIEVIEDSVKKTIEDHLKKVKEERNFVLLLNKYTFLLSNYFCLGLIKKEELNNVFENNYEANFYIKIKCINDFKSFEFSTKENIKKCKIYSSYLYTLEICNKK